MKTVAAGFSVLLSLFIATACGGGDGQGEVVGEGQPTNQTPSPTIPSSGGPGLNGGLTGRLITNYQFQPYEFDLSSGAATALPLVSSFEFYQDRPETENASKWNFFAAGDSTPNQGYVETLYNCLILPTGSCLSVYDSNFQVVKRVRVADRILEEPAKLSPSGRYVVMSDVSGFNLDTSIQIMDVDASSVIDFSSFEHGVPGRGIAPYHPIMEWGTNDEIYYSVPADDRPTVYVTTPASLDVVRTIRLPTSYRGRINNLDIHPNGNLLLIEYRGFSNSSSSIIIVLDLNTLNLRIPAVNEVDLDTVPIGDNFVSEFKNPTWSPDGQHIMFLNTFTTGVNPVVVPGFNAPQDFMIVVPAESNRVIVNGWQGGSPVPSVSPAIVIQLEDPSLGQLTFDWPSSSSLNKGHVEWVD